jgi:DNA-binding NarL/FixJ family response regulator
MPGQDGADPPARIAARSTPNPPTAAIIDLGLPKIPDMEVMRQLRVVVPEKVA